MDDQLRLGTVLWSHLRRAVKSRFLTFTPPRLPQEVLTKASRASVTRMDLIFMLATFVTLKATRSHCSPAIQTALDETDNEGFGDDKTPGSYATREGRAANARLRSVA